MKKCLIIWFCLCVFVLSPLALAVDKPNIVLILTDDQGYGDISSHGNRMINTPNLDQLAKDLRNFLPQMCVPRPEPVC